jgi:hypothetical protein
MKNLKKTVLVFILLSVISSSAFAELRVLVGYNSQDPVIDTLRTQLLYYGDKTGFWEKQFFMNSSFYNQGFEYSIPIRKDHPKLTYKLWIQPKPATLVAILPGLGSFYTNSMSIALAQAVYNAGYSVFVVSNAMNWEFMQSASTTLIPGYTPQDAEDVYYALYKIITHIREKYKTRVTENALIGYSLGGMHALFIAKLDGKYNLINFNRFIAINPPVNLLYGLKQLDDFFSVSEAWSKRKREQKKVKAGTIYQLIIKKMLSQNGDMPFNTTEAKYLIGFVFHTSLVEAIFSIHQRKDLGVLKASYDWFSRNTLYKEINTFDYYKYLKLFALPYYSKEFGHKVSIQELNKKASLTAITNTLETNDKIRVVHNIDDFLLTPADIKWLEKTLGDRILLFDKGGHLGNLYRDDVLKWIVDDIAVPSAKQNTNQLKTNKLD